MAISFKDEDHAWFADMENFKATRQPLEGMKVHYRKRFFRETTTYVWDEPTLFRIGIENLLRQCVTKGEQASILWHCHNSLYGDSHNIKQFTHFDGPDQIFIGNSEGLSISNTGSTSFISPNDVGITFKLHKLLHVPSISKVLVNLPKITLFSLNFTLMCVL